MGTRNMVKMAVSMIPCDENHERMLSPGSAHCQEPAPEDHVGILERHLCRCFNTF